jgi:hypothetical protein
MPQRVGSPRPLPLIWQRQSSQSVGLISPLRPPLYRREVMGGLSVYRPGLGPASGDDGGYDDGRCSEASEGSSFGGRGKEGGGAATEMPVRRASQIPVGWGTEVLLGCSHACGSGVRSSTPTPTNALPTPQHHASSPLRLPRPAPDHASRPTHPFPLYLFPTPSHSHPLRRRASPSRVGLWPSSTARPSWRTSCWPRPISGTGGSTRSSGTCRTECTTR